MVNIEMNDIPAAVRQARPHIMRSVQRSTTVSNTSDVVMPAAQEHATISGRPSSGQYVYPCNSHRVLRSPRLHPIRQRVVLAAARLSVRRSLQNEGLRIEDVASALPLPLLMRGMPPHFIAMLVLGAVAQL
jgi:hypothetical protein